MRRCKFRFLLATLIFSAAAIVVTDVSADSTSRAARSVTTTVSPVASFPAASVSKVLRRALGNGSAFDVNVRKGELHLLTRFKNLQVHVGNLQVLQSQSGSEPSMFTIVSSSPTTISATAVGHDADQDKAPQTRIMVQLGTLNARVDASHGTARVDLPIKVTSSDYFVPFTDAKHHDLLFATTTTRAWAGPRPFSVALIATVQVSVSKADNEISIEILAIRPRNKSQTIEIGGWVRLPKWLRSFNPDLAGCISPLDAKSVRVKVDGFGDRTVANPLRAIIAKLKGKRFEFK